MHVLFWDIDGTLLTTARAGGFAFEEAAQNVLGTKLDFSKLSTSGLTDAQVAALVARACGATPEPETVAALLRAYERHLPDRLHWRRGDVLAGVREILEDLQWRPGVHSLLLTGNTPTGAQAKLAHYGLAAYFTEGAFCTDSSDREAIARQALTLAQDRSTEALAPEQLFVIGDTPHDVRAGNSIGARTVAVASGVHSLAELQACHPWLALDRFPPPEEFARYLGLPESSTAPLPGTP